MKPIKSFAPSVPQCDIWDWAISSADCSERCQKTGQNAFRETTLCERMGALPLNLGHCIIAKEFTRRERRQVKEVEKRIERFSWKKIRQPAALCIPFCWLEPGGDFRRLRDGPSAYLVCPEKVHSSHWTDLSLEELGLFVLVYFSVTKIDRLCLMMVLYFWWDKLENDDFERYKFTLQ